VGDDVRMSMDPGASPNDSCQLSTRSWTITDEEGREEKVEGPGVVGQSRYISYVFNWTMSYDSLISGRIF